MAQRDLSKKEKLLLQLMGRDPDLTNEELSTIIGFKYAEYVSTLQKKLRNREYLNGPFMFPDFKKIFRNRVCRVIAFIMFDTPYTYIKSLLQEVSSWIYFHPLEEGIFRKYMVGFINTDIPRLKRVFDCLEDEGIIQYYHLFEQEDNWKIINPTFLIDGKEAPIEPDFEHLLSETSLPDVQHGSFIGTPLSKVAQMLIEHLSLGREECDLKKIVRWEKNYRKEQRAALREMLKKEKGKSKKKLRSKLKELKRGLSLKEFRETYQFLIENQILEKMYYTWPFPYSRCSQFWLFLKCNSLETTTRAIFNFGKDVRVSTRVSLIQSVETGAWYGLIYAVGDPVLGQKLMIALDKYPEIEDRKLFPIRTYPTSHWATQSLSIDEYYNSETQTLEYPYDLFYERVKQRVEEDLD